MLERVVNREECCCSYFTYGHGIASADWFNLYQQTMFLSALQHSEPRKTLRTVQSYNTVAGDPRSSRLPRLRHSAALSGSPVCRCSPPRAAARAKLVTWHSAATQQQNADNEHRFEITMKDHSRISDVACTLTLACICVLATTIRLFSVSVQSQSLSFLGCTEGSEPLLLYLHVLNRMHIKAVTHKAC